MLPETRIAYLERRSAISDGAAASFWPALFKKELEFEHEFVKRGGLLLAGLDPTGYGGVIAGFGDQREVELLVEAGFNPLEAIHIATANGAEFLGEQDQIGTLARGKAADVVVIDGDPLANIKDIEKVDIVFKDGVLRLGKIDRIRAGPGRPALEGTTPCNLLRFQGNSFFPSAEGRQRPSRWASVGAISRNYRSRPGNGHQKRRGPPPKALREGRRIRQLTVLAARLRFRKDATVKHVTGWFIFKSTSPTGNNDVESRAGIWHAGSVPPPSGFWRVLTGVPVGPPRPRDRGSF
jgi:hypothetical protein